MPKRRMAVVIAMAAALLLLSPATDTGALPHYEMTYTVWYDYNSCIISPMVPSIEGEWTSDCQGLYYGWGWEPGHQCSYTVISQGAECEPTERVPK